MHGSNGFNVPVEAVKRRIQASHESDNSAILIALAEDKIIERAKQMNLRNIELEVVADNKAAIALYHKMGFSDIGIYKDYWFANDVYSDAIVMQKCLKKRNTGK